METYLEEEPEEEPHVTTRAPQGDGNMLLVRITPLYLSYNPRPARGWKLKHFKVKSAKLLVTTRAPQGDENKIQSKEQPRQLRYNPRPARG